MSKNSQHSEIISAIRHLVLNNEITSQAQLIDKLESIGFGRLQQSMISRILRKLGAIRVVNTDNSFIYQLPHELEMPSTKATIESMINDIDYNTSFVVIKTTPAAAEIVARLIGSVKKQLNILGAVAGDDAILISPRRGCASMDLCEKLINLFDFKQ